MNHLKSYEIYLTEKSNTKHDYGCIMAQVGIDEDSWADLTGMIDKDDLHKEGIEDEPHITILYGLHEEIRTNDVLKVLNNYTENSINARISDISASDIDDYDVLKFDIESDDLRLLNQMYKELPHTNKFSEYKPHMTIGYLHKNRGGYYVNLFKEKLSQMIGEDISISKLIWSPVSGDKETIDLSTRNHI